MIVQTMNRSIEEIDGIRHGDTRYKDLNPQIIDTVILSEGRRTLVALHASSVCFSEQLDYVPLYMVIHIHDFQEVGKGFSSSRYNDVSLGDYFPTFQEHSTFIFRVKQSMKNTHVAKKGYYIGMGRARAVACEPKGQ